MLLDSMVKCADMKETGSLCVQMENLGQDVRQKLQGQFLPSFYLSPSLSFSTLEIS